MSEVLEETGSLDWLAGERGTRWPLSKHSNAYSSSLIVKTGAGKLFGFSVFNSNAATQYILLFDRRDVPADGATNLAMVFPVATLSTLLVGYDIIGRPFDAGCVLVNSSTANSLTIGSADCWFDAQYL